MVRDDGSNCTWWKQMREVRGVSSHAFWHAVRDAYDAAGEGLFSPRLDFSPPDPARSLRLQSGDEPPPPNSGAEVYEALLWIWDHCVDFTPLMAEMEGAMPPSSPTAATRATRVPLLVGRGLYSLWLCHWGLRQCWAFAAPYVSWWVNDLLAPCWAEPLAYDWAADGAVEGSDGFTGSVTWERRRAFWGSLVRASGARDEVLADSLTGASLRCQYYARQFARRYESVARRVSEARGMPWIRDLHGLLLTGYALSSWSARLTGPPLLALHRRLLSEGEEDEALLWGR